MMELSSLFGTTMLVERFLGVTVYTATLLFFCIRIKKSGSPQDIKKLLRAYLIVLCIMSFFYIPGDNADLYRWRIIANSWVGTPIHVFIQNRILSADTPLAYLLMYLCQTTGINGLLPMVCALIFFGNVFHCINALVQNYSVDSESVAVGLLFFMAPGLFLETISGVRCFVSFSIICRCFCDEILIGKSIWKNIPLYVCACLFHTAGLALIAARLFVFLFEKNRNKWMKVINVLAIAFMSVIAFRYGYNYVDATLTKAASYTSQTTYQYIWEYIIGGIGLLVIIYNSVYGFRNDQWQGVTKNLSRLLLVLAIVELVFITTYSIFHRYIAASTIICTPLIILLCSNSNSNLLVKKRNIIIVSLIMLLLACTRGNLCGYKFFLL